MSGDRLSPLHLRPRSSHVVLLHLVCLNPRPCLAQTNDRPIDRFHAALQGSNQKNNPRLCKKKKKKKITDGRCLTALNAKIELLLLSCDCLLCFFPSLIPFLLALCVRVLTQPLRACASNRLHDSLLFNRKEPL